MPSKCCNTTWFPDRADIHANLAPDGQPTPDYSGDPFKKSVPGRIIETGGDETFRGRQLEAHISHVYECRYFPGVTATMRLTITAGIYKGRILNIRHANIMRKKGAMPKYELKCTELAAS